MTGQHSRRLLPGLLMYKVVGHIDPHHTAGIPDGAKLLIRQVPANIAQGPAVGVGGDHRPLHQIHNIPKAAVTGVGYIRQDVQPLHPADRLPAQLRQALVRIAAGAAGQQVFLVPRQHPHSGPPLCILFQPLQPVTHRLHALHAQKGEQLSLRLRFPGLRRRPYKRQPGALCQLLPSAGHHLLRPPPAVPVRVSGPDGVLFHRCPDGKPQAADLPRLQSRQVTPFKDTVLSGLPPLGHII